MFKRDEGILKNNFGSKRGFVRSIKHRVMNFLGFYNSCKNIDFHSVERMIFVCSGNICRSPLAEAASTALGIPSESFGLNCRGGDKADPRAIRFANEWELSLEDHITRNISDYQHLPGDLLVGMEPKHLLELRNRFPDERIRMTLAGLWLETPQPYLHDPFNTNQIFFGNCEAKVIQSTRSIAKKVKY